VEELRTAADVDAAPGRQGTTLVVVNSVCGCAARNARPAVARALAERPARRAHDRLRRPGRRGDAARARATSSAIRRRRRRSRCSRTARSCFMLERHQIEGRSSRRDRARHGDRVQPPLRAARRRLTVPAAPASRRTTTSSPAAARRGARRVVSRRRDARPRGACGERWRAIAPCRRVAHAVGSRHAACNPTRSLDQQIDALFPRTRSWNGTRATA
jgi:putative YphP/YqiW family bacilliredoxin